MTGIPFVSLLQQLLPIKFLLSPSPPPPSNAHRPDAPKLAIVGAGITGLTSAAHCIGHGFSDITIFEATPFPGGIWATGASSHTSLQINSLIYRPSTDPSSLKTLFREYNLTSKTLFNTKVEDIYQDHRGKWIINSPRFGRFDGVICCIGAVGEARVPRLPGMDRFLRAGREVWHSSRLAGGIAGASAPTTPKTLTPPTITEPKVIATARRCDVKDKKVVIIDAEEEGSGLIEALEFAAAGGAQSVTVLLAGKNRGNKWVVSRGAVGAAVVMAFGKGLADRLIPEALLRRLFYRNVEDLVVMLDADTVEKLGSIKAEWIPCSIDHFTNTGINISCHRGGRRRRGKVVTQEAIDADVVVMATGYKQPQLTTFLPGTCFPPTYRPPKWHLGTFPTNHPSIACLNYGGGTFSDRQIGLNTRILLMFLLDPRTMPSPFWMRRWIDVTRVLKATSLVGNLYIFCYVELICWFVIYISFNPFRWRWVLFILFGVELLLPGGSRMGNRRGGLGMQQHATTKAQISSK
ncbi:hypothetical protein QBC44DRAFT_334550 [Cladorrhinum sp. PSN332]|nr:hypothetical protein QBC44DRAFT_334550 [Cladorrhinum sp. PSN332]